MLPTVRAVELQEPVRRALAQLNEVLALPTSFDPKTSRTKFLLTAYEYIEYALAPPLLARLRSEAPSVEVEFRFPLRERMLEWLEQGDIDFRLAVQFRDKPRSLRSKTLLRERLVCLARKGHPVIRGQLTPELFFSVPHIRPRIGYDLIGREIDALVASLKRKIHVSAQVESFLTVSHVVARTDMVATLPEFAARLFAANLPLQILELPFALSDSKIFLFWHERTHRQPSHRWFRQLLSDVTKTL